MKNILILHNKPLANRDDEADTLVQVAEVSSALEALNYNHSIGSVSSLIDVENLIKKHQPQLVFNLVESFCGSDKDSYLIPAYLESQGLACTGCSANALFISGDKVASKKIMRGFNIPTPDCLNKDSLSQETFIVKSVTEHASFGMDADSVVMGASNAQKLIQEKELKFGGKWLAEQYIAGREFNVSVIGTKSSPEILPLAEIIFQDFAEDTPKIVDYAAKWGTQSHGYNNTPRHFIDEAAETALVKKIKEITLRCWSVFGLDGYARVDFRVDEDGSPYVLEINANPGLTSDAGFIAAAAKSGMNYIKTINHIMEITNHDYEAEPAKTSGIGQ